MTKHEKDIELYNLVHTVIKGIQPDLKAVKKLLEQGANPKAINKHSGVSAYALVEQNNAGGSHNALLEVFDEHISVNGREMDSVGEGMHLKSDE